MAQPKIGRSFAKEQQEPEPVAVVPGPTLDEATELLMTYLPTDVQTYIREAAGNMHLPVWQCLLGYTIKAAERFELFAPIILSSWETGGRPNVPRPCGTCGVEFTSRFPDAKYCCSNCFFSHLDDLGHTKDCYLPKAG